MRPLERLFLNGRWRLWLIALPGVLAVALNATALRSGWLSNVGYVYLDAIINRPARPAPGAPERWFQAADEAAGQQRFETSYGLALLYLSQKRYPEAISALQAALDADPGSSGSHALLGDAYDGIGDDSLAVAEWQAGQVAPVLLARGAEQGRAGNWPAAVRWYQLATQVDPGSAAAFWQLGLAYGSAGQPQAEVDALLRAVSLSPDNVQIRHALGLAYMSQGAFESAAAQFERVLATAPDDYYTNLYLAEVDLALGRLDAAESSARKAVQLSAGDPRPHFALGSVYFHLGQWPPAIDELEMAAALVAPWNHASSLPVSRADEAGYNLLLAQAYQSASQATPAIAAYQAVLRLEPDNAAALAALKTLQPQGPP